MVIAFLLIAMQAMPNTTSAPVDPNHELRFDMEIDQAFLTASDADHDGSLSLVEFETAMDRRIDAAIAGNPAAQANIRPEQRSGIRDRVLAPAFRSFDRDADGQLTMAEITARLQQLRRTRPAS